MGISVTIRGKVYDLDGVLPLTWGDMKAGRKAGVIPSGTNIEAMAASDGLLLWVVKKVFPEATMEDIDALSSGIALKIIQGASAENPLPSSSTSAISSDAPSGGPQET